MTLLINLTSGYVLQEATTLSQRTNIELSRNDFLTLSLKFYTETGTSATPLARTNLPSPYTGIRVAAKEPNRSSLPNLLFEVAPADFTAVLESGYYTYKANLNLQTTELRDALSSQVAIQALLDVQLEGGALRWTCLSQQVITVAQDIADETAVVPTVGTPGYPAVERVLPWRADLVQLTGNTSDSLDGQPTAGGAATIGDQLMLPYSGRVLIYRLDAGTAATAAPSVIRPADYASSTNEVYWQIVNTFVATRASTAVWRSTRTSLTGGTSSTLDNIVTAAPYGPAGGEVVSEHVTLIERNGVLDAFRLEAGTDAEAAPEIIRPDDYASSTNEKVWKRKGFAIGWQPAPLTATDPGEPGQVAYDGASLYLCIATDTWMKAALTTF